MGVMTMFKQFELFPQLDASIIRAYRNLHTGQISLLDKASGLVVGHCDAVRLVPHYLQDSVKCIVNQAGRERVLRERKKYVHAFIEGAIERVAGFVSYKDRSYVKFYARKNLLTGDLLPFKDVESYFNKDFTNRIQMNKWLEQLDPLDAQEYIQSKILRRVYDKKRNFLPFHLELEHCFLPKLDIIKKMFGSYSHFAKSCDLDLMFDKNIPLDFFDGDLPKDIEIAIDTREQKPLDFKFNTKKHKLSFGDYTLLGVRADFVVLPDRQGSHFWPGGPRSRLARATSNYQLRQRGSWWRV